MSISADGHLPPDGDRADPCGDGCGAVRMLARSYAQLPVSQPLLQPQVP